MSRGGRRLADVVVFVRRVTAIAAMLAATTVSAPIASAQSSVPEPEIIDAMMFIGESGTSVARVTLSSPLPVKGELRLGASYTDSSQSSSVVELPTGGERIVWLTMPAGSTSYSSEEVTWDIPKGQDPRASFTRSIASIAVLPSALGSRKVPNTLSTIGRTGTVRFAALTLDDIEQRGWILGGFHTLATTARELTSLSPNGQQVIAAWVERGGELLVDDDSTVPFLKTQPKPGASAIVGAGVVSRTGNAMRTGQWESILLPSLRWKPENYSGSYFEPTIGVSLRDSIKLAPVGPLLGALALYAIVLGPLVYVMSKRKNKPMLMWAVIPAVSILTTGAVVGIGTALRRTANDQLVVATLYGETANSQLLIRAVTEGSSAKRLKLAPGWSASSSDTNFSVTNGASLSTSIELLPGQVSEVRFKGTTPPAPAPFTAEYLGNDKLKVTNVSTQKLVNVTVIRGSNSFDRSAAFGDIPAGATRTFTLNVSGASGAENDLQIADQLVSSNLSFVVIAESAASSISNSKTGIPAQLVDGAKVLPGRHLVQVSQPGPQVGNNFFGAGSTDDPPVYRIDFLGLDTSKYIIEMYNGEIWDGSEYVPLGSSIPPTALVNGAVLVRGTDAPKVMGAGPKPTASSGADVDFIE
jgi:hypothetical protein